MLQEMLKYRTNEKIRQANAGVRDLAKKHGATYLDLNAPITDEEGCLKREYTLEGIHMYANGYKLIFEQMLPVLHDLCASKSRGMFGKRNPEEKVEA